MKVIEEIAAILDIDSGELERESLKAYLERKLRALEADRFQIASKHGVTSVEDMKSSFSKGKLKEEQAWEDFFRLDHLEAEIELVNKALKEVK